MQVNGYKHNISRAGRKKKDAFARLVRRVLSICKAVYEELYRCFLYA